MVSHQQLHHAITSVLDNGEVLFHGDKCFLKASFMAPLVLIDKPTEKRLYEWKGAPVRETIELVQQ
jgi:hypothetical protein